MADGRMPAEWDRVIAARYLRHKIEQEIGKNPKHGAMSDLSRSTGVNRQAFSNIVNSARAGTSVETFDRFARYFRTTHDAFFREACVWAAKHPDVLEAAEKVHARESNPLARFTDAELLAELMRRRGK